LRTVVGLSQPISDNQAQKLDGFAMTFNRTMRQLYVDLIINKKNTNILKSYCIANNNLNARHYNSIKFSVEGKAKSVIELNKNYLTEAQDNLKSEQKYIKSLEGKIKNFSKELKECKEKSSEKLLIASQNKIRDNLAYAQQREAKLIEKISKHQEIVESGNPHLCFGSQKLWKRRTTGYYKTHQAWLDEWRFQRNKEVCFVGSSDEVAGNLNAQIRHIEGDKFGLKLNVNPNASRPKEKYIELFFTLNYEVEYIKKVIQNNLNGVNKSALTYRVSKVKNNKKRHNQYTIAVTFDEEKRFVKQSQDFWLGCVGVDINQEHLAICETNHQGNYVASCNEEFDVTQTSFQNINSLTLAVKNLIVKAKATGKPIVMEKLDFVKKKASLKSGYNKRRNVQLSSFAYSKIKYLIQARAADAGIEVIEVNPAYTSVIGKAKYSHRLGVSIHQAAAFAIARRGMRLKERVKVNLATPGLSVRNGLGDCTWAKVQKLIQQEIIRPNTRKARIKRSERLATLNPCRSFLSKLE
jgi:IS605 OrfB family transposase